MKYWRRQKETEKKYLFCRPQGNYIGRISSSLTLLRHYKIVQITTNKKEHSSIYALYGNTEFCHIFTQISFFYVCTAFFYICTGIRYPVYYLTISVFGPKVLLFGIGYFDWIFFALKNV
jgi:hypothetical protein